MMLSAQLEDEMRFEAQKACDEAAALIVSMYQLEGRKTYTPLATVHNLFESLIVKPTIVEPPSA